MTIGEHEMEEQMDDPMNVLDGKTSNNNGGERYNRKSDGYISTVVLDSTALKVAVCRSA